MPNKNYENHLMYLLQDIYFDNIDTANADKASEAMHDDVRWVHNQVWEHDAHKTNIRDTLNGRKKVKEFLRKRITELQIEGIVCLLYTSPSPRDRTRSRMPSSA